MDIEFIGATLDVTGSMTLVSNSLGGILIDCGLYQGTKEMVLRNRDPLSFDPKTIKAIILTHAHLDHSGMIPRLVKLGFRGDIFCTKATMKLAKVIMNDSARLLKNEDHLLHGLYGTEDVAIVTSLFKLKKNHEMFDVIGLRVEFAPAGHILGATSVIIKENDETVVFSGDLGRFNDPIIHPPTPCPSADAVMMESTYGNRVRHGKMEEELSNFLRLIKSESLVGIIASFAVARAQLLITLIHRFYQQFPEQKVRIVIDSPMMVEANNIYRELSHETQIPDELNRALIEVEVIDQPREWESIKKKDGPLIIIASSGMVAGGRIWRYLENWQDDDGACLFLPGYQGVGTAGRVLSEGGRIIVDEDGKKIHWHGRVITSDAFSSHADQEELCSWIQGASKETKIYLNHGETQAKEELKKELLRRGYKHVQVVGPKEKISV